MNKVGRASRSVLCGTAIASLLLSGLAFAYTSPMYEWVGGYGQADITPDGRYIAFATGPNDSETHRTILVRALQGESSYTASNGTDGTPNADSFRPALSATGRRVVFSSAASNLVHDDPDPSGRVVDVFLFDADSSSTHLVSRAMHGGRANGLSPRSDISADGETVVFESNASNLVPGDTNDASDVFAYDVSTGTTTLVSRSLRGGSANAFSSNPRISGNGRFVVFDSPASDLVRRSGDGFGHVYRYNLKNGVMKRVSVGPDGEPGQGNSGRPSVSHNGSSISFTSVAENLTPGKQRGQQRAYLRRMGKGTLAIVRGHRAGASEISSSGDFVAVETLNAETADAAVYLYHVQERRTQRVSVFCGDGGTGFDPTVSSDGRYVAFTGYSWILLRDMSYDCKDVEE